MLARLKSFLPSLGVRLLVPLLLTVGAVLWGTQEAAQRQATAATKHSPAQGTVLAAYDDAGVVVEVANSKIQGKTVASMA